jgi:hypothetical protein
MYHASSITNSVLEQHVIDLINGFQAAPRAGAWVDALHDVGPLGD